MKKVNVGIIGFGTIGSGVVKYLIERRKFIKDKNGIDISLSKVCDKELRKKRPVKPPKKMLTSNPGDIIRDKNIDIVVELIGGVNPAKDIILRALKNKKHVVTANKAVLASCGKELFAAAKKNKREIYFEASVGGGIPIVKTLKESFISNRIQTIYGIINGTSNYILTKMERQRFTLEEALEAARIKGFAERNPALDINGMDSAHKLAILVLLGFGKSIGLDEIYTQGIEEIEPQDLEYASELGYVVRLLAIAKNVAGRLEARVHPTLLPKEHLLSSICGVNNAIFIKGDLVGESLLYGKGAGQMPTSSAVISDIVDLGKIITSRAPAVKSPNFPGNVKRIRKMNEVKSRYYVHFSAIDQPGVLASISGILGRLDISIASVTQKERKKERIVPIVMMTHEAKEKNMQKALKTINSLKAIKRKPIAIRVED
jgi:homoserine dehydrogenase